MTTIISMYNISKLNSGDLEEAFSIETISHALPWSRAVFYSNQGKGYINYKIKQDSQIIGFCIIKIVIDEATLFNVAIKLKFQNQGIATTLLNHVIDSLRTKKIRTLWLEVRASNKKAIYLYESLGFNEVSIRHNYYPTNNGQYENAIIMVKTLIIDTVENK